jgi:cytochrome c553
MNSAPFVLALALVAISGCAPRERTPIAPPVKSGVPSVKPADDEWKATSWEERHDVMTWRVLPHFGRAFQTFEHAASPSLACTSCHGKDAEAVGYKMPNGLPALDPAHLPDPKTNATARFMFEVVTPDMAEILGRPVFDPATKQGFSCFGCHPVKG